MHIYAQVNAVCQKKLACNSGVTRVSLLLTVEVLNVHVGLYIQLCCMHLIIFALWCFVSLKSVASRNIPQIF